MCKVIRKNSKTVNVADWLNHVALGCVDCSKLYAEGQKAHDRLIHMIAFPDDPASKIYRAQLEKGV